MWDGLGDEIITLGAARSAAVGRLATQFDGKGALDGNATGWKRPVGKTDSCQRKEAWEDADGEDF